jgi:hypothetical protein
MLTHLPNDSCCSERTIYSTRGCADEVPWLRVIAVEGSSASVLWVNESTGETSTTAPVGFSVGACPKTLAGGALTIVPVTVAPLTTGNTGDLPRLEYLTGGREAWLIGSDGNARQIEYAPQVFTTLVYLNAATPATATVFDDVSPPVTHDATLAQKDDNLYIGSDGSTWTWNGTTYTSYTPPARTEWMLAGTTTDAGSDKTSDIYRQGKLLLATGGSTQVVANKTLHVQAGGLSGVGGFGDGLLFSTTSTAGARVFLEHVSAAAGRRTVVFYTENGLTRVGAILTDDASNWVAQNPLVIRNNGGPIAGAVGVNNAAPVSHLDVAGSLGTAIMSTTAANMVVALLEHTIVSKQGNTTVTLPAPTADNIRREYVVKRDPAATAATAVTGHIDGTASATLNVQPGQARKFQSDGTTWWVI